MDDDMKLNHHTIEALEHKLGVAEDTLSTLPDDEEKETRDDWAETVRQLRVVLNGSPRDVEALKANPKALAELADHAGNDMPKAEFEAITADLCRVGYHEVFEPNAVRTYRPRTRTVDGVKYEIGTI